MQANRHIPALDGFRGLAVILVMLSHFLTAGGVLSKHGPLQRLAHGGFVGVDLFFVLSGFLITGILLDAPRDGRFFSVFFGRRAVRIFPLYFAALSLGYVLSRAPAYDSPAWYWCFASNLGATWKGRWLASPEGLNFAHFWSLAVEEQFYLFWPLVVRFLSRASIKRICIALLILAPATHFILHFSGNAVGAYAFTFTRLNTLAAGAWLALALRDDTLWPRVVARAPTCAMVFGAITLAGLMFPKHISLVPFAPFVWGAVLVLAMTHGSAWARLLSHRVLITAGKLSYGLYVWHYFADPWLKQTVFARWIAPAFGSHSVIALEVFVIIAFAASYAAAQISWFILEKPMLGLKRLMPYRSQAASSTLRASSLQAVECRETAQ